MRVIDDRALVDFAAEVGAVGPVAVEGNRTRWQCGGLPRLDARLVKAPVGIAEHMPAEMTVRVRAGTPVAELHAALGAHGQRTALPDRGGTVGGAIAVGENDLMHSLFGRLRSSVLQVRYVSADGRLITAGGRTVKNVSGFDLPRLMTGALGTLGLIAEVTLRSTPLPPVSEWVMLTDIDPFTVTNGWHPHAVVLWDGARTWICLAGHRPDIDEERRRLQSLGDLNDVAGPPTLPPYRWSLRPSDLVSLTTCRTGAFLAAVGSGLVFAERRPPLPATNPAVQRLADRVKHNFDPTHRFNPGRRPGGPHAAST